MKNRLDKNGRNAVVWPERSKAVAEIASRVGTKAGRILVDRAPGLFRDHPLLCIAGAFLAGLALGKWWKR